jgi:very-short-patch-repair endonuclease
MVSDLLKGKFMERNGKLTKNAQSLRQRMTKEEAKLWYQFLCRCQPRFHRQYVIGSYIADFYCHKARLVVELDGSQHRSPEEIEYDQKRTQFLQSQGLTVLRMSNLDVMRQFEAVCEVIDNALKQDPSCNKSETWY